MKKLKLLFVVSFSIFLFGCATGAKMENMAYTDSDATQKNYDEKLKNEVAVSSVSGGEDTNPAWTSEISDENFSGALKESLAKQGLLSETGKYKLKVTLVKVEQPLFGLDMTVTTHVNYTLTDSQENKVVYENTVVTPYTATVGDAFVGVQRLRLANEGSGKENIKTLLDELSKLNIQANEVSLIN